MLSEDEEDEKEAAVTFFLPRFFNFLRKVTSYD